MTPEDFDFIRKIVREEVRDAAKSRPWLYVMVWVLFLAVMFGSVAVTVSQ
jgi:hypothetical protein